MRNPTEVLIHSYYNTFNSKKLDAFLDVLSEDVVHDINQGGREVGKSAFRDFMERMNHAYDEKVVDLQVMTNEDGSRAAAEFTVLGAYINTDDGLPPARGQRYRLQVGAFFELKGGKISRISNSYNVKEWLRQVEILMLDIASLSGEAMRGRLDDLARLRIEVFRAWPYLYKGSLDYERNYLARYAEARTGTLVVAQDEGRIVGASTALGLDEEDDFVQAPFVAAGMDLKGIFYFGESVLQIGYRGQGVGVRFFEAREAAAKRHGYGICVFCAVSRPAAHPARPKDYVPLDDFWGRRGYRKRPDLVSKFSWRDIGERDESEKPMVYWMKTL